MGYTEDAGGSAYVTPSNTSTCNFSNQGSGAGVGTEYYGPFTAQATADIVLSIGTYLPHYAFDLYLNIILQDVDGNDKWKNSPNMWAALIGTSQNKSQSMQTGSGNSNSQNADSGKIITSTK